MKKLKIVLGLIILATVIMSINVNSAFVIKGNSSELIEAYKNNNLIRLHIVASTNSPNDQYIKRMVREQIINYMAKYKKEMAVKKNTSKIRSEFNSGELKKLEAYLDNYLLTKDITCPVHVNFGEYYFPRRTYSELTLPEGKYKALKVELGRGEGANWWCVLMPPLCIEKQDKPKKLLTADVDNKKLEFRLKFLEFFKLSLPESSLESSNEKKHIDLNSINNLKIFAKILLKRRLKMN